MGHDIHFLERVTERVELEHQRLALSLYRNPKLINLIALTFAPQLAADKERFALALDDGGQGPHIIITRTGRFVTCLARGMVLEEGMPILSRATLDAHEAWNAAKKVAPSPELAQALLGPEAIKNAVFHREQIETASALSCWNPKGMMETLEVCLELLADHDKLFSSDIKTLQARANRTALGYEGLLRSWSSTRRYVTHAPILIHLALDSRSPLTRKLHHTGRTAELVKALARLSTPAAMLRAVWLLTQLAERYGFAYLGGMIITLFERGLHAQLSGMIALYAWTQATGRDVVEARGVLEAWSGVLAKEEHAQLKVIKSCIDMLIARIDAPRTSLAERVELWRTLAEDRGPTRWPLPFLDRARLERGEEGLIQALLALDEELIINTGHVALVAAYAPEIALRAAPLLYPIKPAPQPSARARAEHTRDLVRTYRLRLLTESDTIHATDRQGRNEPCACGSGKKYKRCCGQDADVEG